jgi:hypothetical protein
VTAVVHLYNWRLASHCFLLQLVVSLDILLNSPGSTNTFAELQQTLILIFVSAAYSNGDTNSEAQKHRLIFLNQSYELTTSSEGNVARNNFVM